MKVLFISNIGSMNSVASSTDIMTYNIINGLSKIVEDITLVTINNLNAEEEKEKIISDYNNIVKKTYVIKNKLKKNDGKYYTLFKLLLFLFFYKCDKEIKKIVKDIDDDTILVTQSPPLEAIFLARALKKQKKEIRWIQYWSDPVALGGINPEDISVKRLPFQFIEKSCLKYASRIVYGTKTLYKYQSNLYPQFSSIMKYVDVAYLANESGEISNYYENEDDFLYAGNFFKYTRNIEPLYEAFKDNNKKLIIYGDGDQMCTNKNIIFNKRVSPNDLKTIEKKYKNIICLMNSKCIQIPGKTFYDIYSNKNIVVIVDGLHKEEIKEYLKSFNRFIIVDNDAESIKSGIDSINNLKYDLNNIKNNYSPEKIAKDIIG